MLLLNSDVGAMHHAPCVTKIFIFVKNCYCMKLHHTNKIEIVEAQLCLFVHEGDEEDWELQSHLTQQPLHPPLPMPLLLQPLLLLL
jgi:hypothetical protein